MLLDHQKRFQDVCREFKASTSLRRVIASIVCGGGKSIYGPIAAHELIPYRGDGLCWAVPRDNLRKQAEGNFTAPWLRNLIGHNLEIRSATNEVDPIRDKIGYCTSYQALGRATSYRTNPHLEVFKRKRMILLLDEIQSVALDGFTHEALKPLIERASVIIGVSGCLSRYDGKRIAGLDYLPPDARMRSYVDLSDSNSQRYIEYTLADATRDHQIIQIFFELRDAKAEWEIQDNLTGNIIDEGVINSFEGASEYETAKGLMTALNTEFFESLLIEATDYWLARQQVNNRSQFLIVCPSIVSAQKAIRILSQRGVRHLDIATSEDDEAAKAAIERFRHVRKPYLSALVTVGMAYIGMDCPPADVLCCLTHIRSREWIEQMLHRATRYDRHGIPWEQQFATIFAPRDRFFIEIMDEIRAQQAPFVDDRVRGPNRQPPAQPQPTRTRPVESAATTASTHTFEGPPIENNDHEIISVALREAGLFGALAIEPAKRFFEAMNGQKANPNNVQPQQQEESDPIPTPSDREAKWRKDIEDFKRSDYTGGNDPAAQERMKLRGWKIKRMFGKPIDELTEAQLEAVWNARNVWFHVP